IPETGHPGLERLQTCLPLTGRASLLRGEGLNFTSINLNKRVVFSFPGSIPFPHGQALHGNIRTSVDTTTSPSPALMHRVPCQSRRTEQGKRSEEPCFLLDRPRRGPAAKGTPDIVFLARLSLPTLSRWLARTIWLGYAIQFARHPYNTTVLRQEIANFLAKDAIKPVPPAKMKKGFYSPYFIVPKKRRWSETNPRSLS
ncbi:hypothetical protein M9458_026049, partial [Cirrhinus mrigala]